MSNLGIGGLEGGIALVESIEEGLEEIIQGLAARRKMNDASGEITSGHVVGQVAQEGGFPQAGLTVQRDRRVGAQSNGGVAELCLPIQQASEWARAQENGGRARGRSGLLPRHSDVDHAAMHVADLEDVVTDGDLAADTALDMHRHRLGRRCRSLSRFPLWGPLRWMLAQ